MSISCFDFLQWIGTLKSWKIQRAVVENLLGYKREEEALWATLQNKISSTLWQIALFLERESNAENVRVKLFRFATFASDPGKQPLITVCLYPYPRNVDTKLLAKIYSKNIIKSIKCCPQRLYLVKPCIGFTVLYNTFQHNNKNPNLQQLVTSD